MESVLCFLTDCNRGIIFTLLIRKITCYALPMTRSYQFLGKHFFIGVVIIGLFKPIASNFETTSNASQFVSLENLIGSLHQYASEDAQLFVRDMGLNIGQRLLLAMYQNVQVVPTTYKMPENTRSIHVENELISGDDLFAERRSSGSLLYVDSIRKRFRLAVVIPFIGYQIDQLTTQLYMSDIYLPCKSRYDSVDLIFYHGEAPFSSLEMTVRQIKFVNKCYQNILFLAANLTDHQNHYLADTDIMWLKLLLESENSVVALRTLGYTHFFFMKLDTIPIRSFWLDVIVRQIKEGYCEKSYCTTDWWMSGSIYRSPNPIYQRSLYINGNALYHLSSSFISFVQLFSRTHLSKPDLLIGYDLGIFLFLFDNPDLTKELWHKFRFSDFIQSCGRPGCLKTSQGDQKQFVLNNPYTFLIYGGSPAKKTAKNENYNFQWILLLCIMLIVIFLWWYPSYRCRLKLLQIVFRFF